MARSNQQRLYETCPTVTVIMPIRDEAAYITRSLSAVLAQDYPPERLEIIVVDGLSTDGSRDIVAALQRQHPNLRLVDNPGKIVPTGLNLAIAQARGEIIIRVDGHCEIAPDYVKRCVAHLGRDNRVAAVGGPLETVGETAMARVIAVAMSSKFGVGGSGFRTGNGQTKPVDTVAFPAYPRRILAKAGPFDEELVRNQDDEYNYRLRQMGAKILLAADVRARYFSRSSLRSLWGQYFQYGYWKVRVMQKHPWQMRPRQFVPPLFVATLLGLALAAAMSTWGRSLLVLVIAAYGLANLAASIRASRRDSWQRLPLLAVAFAILHLSYGLGFLTGLVKFWKRWRGNSSNHLAPAHISDKVNIEGPRP